MQRGCFDDTKVSRSWSVSVKQQETELTAKRGRILLTHLVASSYSKCSDLRRILLEAVLQELHWRLEKANVSCVSSATAQAVTCLASFQGALLVRSFGVESESSTSNLDSYQKQYYLALGAASAALKWWAMKWIGVCRTTVLPSSLSKCESQAFGGPSNNLCRESSEWKYLPRQNEVDSMASSLVVVVVLIPHQFAFCSTIQGWMWERDPDHKPLIEGTDYLSPQAEEKTSLSTFLLESRARVQGFPIPLQIYHVHVVLSLIASLKSLPSIHNIGVLDLGECLPFVLLQVTYNGSYDHMNIDATR